MKIKRKIIISIVILVVLIPLICAVIVKKEISDKVLAIHDEMMTNLELINDFNIDDVEYNICNNSWDVFLKNSNDQIHYWYRVNKSNDIKLVTYNNTAESGYVFNTPSNSKKRQMQYNTLNYIKQRMYTSNIVITEDRMEDDRYIMSLYLPDRNENITVEVDSTVKNKNGNYNRIQFME